MTFAVHVKQVSLQNFLPQSIVDVAKSASAARIFLDAQADLARGKALLLTGLPALPVNAAVLAARTALTLVQNIISDIQNTGVSFLIIPPTPGGLPGVRAFLQASLLNARDPNRPIFQDASIYAFGALAYAPDATQIQISAQAIQRAFLSNSQAARASLQELFPPSDAFFPATSRNANAGRPQPIPESPWVTLRIAQFIPGADELLTKMNNFLSTVSSIPVEEVSSAFTRFLNQSSQNLSRLIAKIDDIVKFIESLFVALPLIFFNMPEPELGSTRDLAASVNRWLDPEVNTQFAPVGIDFFTTGFFVVGGNADPQEAINSYKIFHDLILSTVV